MAGRSISRSLSALSTMRHLEHQVLDSLRSLPLSKKGGRVGVACSGGPDSMALLAVVRTLAPLLRLQVYVLHVNHGLRAESVDEEKLVRSVCSDWHVPVFVERLTPPTVNSGTEVWAREARYKYFLKIKGQARLSFVFTGHTEDDQAETVLLHLMRGAARRGLSGIAPLRNGWLARPFLGCSRRHIENYNAAKRIPSVEDPSNQDITFTRNRVRHHLLPILRTEFSPQIGKRLASLARVTRDEEELLEDMALKSRRRVETEEGFLSIPKLLSEPVGLRARILRLWAEERIKNLQSAHILALRDLTLSRTSGPIQLPGKMRAARVRDTVIIESDEDTVRVEKYEHQFEGVGNVYLNSRWSVSVLEPVRWSGGPAAARCGDLWRTFFDCAVVSPDRGLSIRSYRLQDRIQPMGMEGHKRVRDVLSQNQIRPSLRNGFPVVEVHGVIAWIPGCARAALATVTAESDYVYMMRVAPLAARQKL